MSNLGGYQWITTAIKALGGPAKAVAISVSAVAVAGYAILRGAELGVKKGYKAVKAAKARNVPCPTKGQIFTVVSDGEDSVGLKLRGGDEYRVLEGDGDAILIEVLGDPDSPYFVSGAFLATISDFPADGSTTEP